MRTRWAWMVLASLMGCALGGEEPATTTEASAALAGADVAATGCGGTRWCWERGTPVTALHGAADDAVFAATAAGTMLEWTGAGWRVHPALSASGMRSVWVAAKDDVWATAADRRVFHYDGTRWTEAPVKGDHVHGSSPRNVWIGPHRFDGTAWTNHAPASPRLAGYSDVLAVGEHEAYLLGLVFREPGALDLEHSLLLHFDGTSWHEVEPLVKAGFGARLLLVRGELRVQAGTTWRRQDGGWQPDEAAFPSASDASTAERVVHDGQDYRRIPASSPCRTVVGIDDDTAFCFGDAGVIQRFDATRWVDTQADPFRDTLGFGAFGSVPLRLWAGGGARLAWGSRPADVWRVRGDAARPEASRQVIEHYDGSVWHERASVRAVERIAASAADDVWFVGDPLLHWDGARLHTVAPPARPAPLHFHAGISFGPRAAFFLATGSDGTELLRYDGAWSVVKQSGPQHTFHDLTGTDPHRLWLLGSSPGPTRRSPELGTLHALVSGVWTETALGEEWGYKHVALHRDRLWISSTGGIAAYTASGHARVTVFAVGGSPLAGVTHYEPAPLSAYRAELWLGERDLWLTTEREAVRHALP